MGAYLLNSRIVGYDVACTVAILAMIVANFTVMMDVATSGWIIDALYGGTAALYVML